MPYLNGQYYPLQIADGQLKADVPLEILKAAQSLRGRRVNAYTSTSERDDDLQSIPSALRRGAIIFDGQWRGYTGVGESSGNYTSSALWSFDRVRGDRVDNPGIQVLGLARIDAAACFFDGQSPKSITVTSAMGDPAWTFSHAGFDGDGALIRVFNCVTNVLMPIGQACAFNWIAYRR